ncbi:MAG: protein phosphatase 2C domain-containing protein [Hydrogenobacter thermophilus]|uniref:PP2C family protein-serine/threonine phosphatase n=1 Tax=Hydrogenobacter thermophilus TaxID=940 RepID=UPI001C77DEDC|nr:protein phosphatase 2C domain-containing protein [Hydrogenobacter thermophilus]QWK19675.1 MAG: protein phosphatase 2C domain-containing protein [Hydrogenobacter thermophilus]
MYRLSACGITHRGKVRTKNEDALLLGDTLVQEEVMTSPVCVQMEGKSLLFAVADGLGGHACGEMASLITLKTLMEEKPQDAQSINQALHKARDHLEAYAKENPYAQGLGSAVAGLLFGKQDILVFNVGDCRVYGLKEGKADRLTLDHTEVERLVRLGYISDREAKHHPNRHVLTSALIGDASFREFEVFIKKAEGYKSFVICSDGLWELVEDDELYLSPSELLNIALSRGGTDNISLIRVDLA